MSDIRHGSSQVHGTISHDEVLTSEDRPLVIGGHSSDAMPTAVSGNGDATRSWIDRFGRFIVGSWFPPTIAADSTMGPKATTLTTTGNVALVPAPGASKSIYVTSVAASNTSSTKTRVDIKDGTTSRCEMMLAADGGGFIHYFTPPWKVTANGALNGALGTAVTDVRVTVHYFTDP